MSFLTKAKNNMDNIKVLFLDIDGVVNAKNTPTSVHTALAIDPQLAFLVGKIILATDCKLVLSSSWRHFQLGVETVHKKVHPVYDKTGVRGETRGEEVKNWLDEHPEVSKYAILDDSTDFLPEQMDNFFQTDWEIGITPEIADEVIKHLGA